MKESLKVLVYKRTHKGDPDDAGIFGVGDCMGSVRKRDFDAVIGVGGKRPNRGNEDIARKVNWIGIGRHKVGEAPKGPLLKFDWFRRFDETGPELEELAPRLSSYLFRDGHDVRTALSQNLHDKAMQDEVQDILRWAKKTKQLQKPAPLSPKKRSPKGGC